VTRIGEDAPDAVYPDRQARDELAARVAADDHTQLRLLSPARAYPFAVSVRQRLVGSSGHRQDKQAWQQLVDRYKSGRRRITATTAEMRTRLSARGSPERPGRRVSGSWPSGSLSS